VTRENCMSDLLNHLYRRFRGGFVDFPLYSSDRLNPIGKIALSFQRVLIHVHISSILTPFHDHCPAALTFERRLMDVWINAAYDAALPARPSRDRSDDSQERRASPLAPLSDETSHVSHLFDLSRQSLFWF
jgi:hypothetical protein